VEIPYQIVLGIVVFACYYYAVVGVQSSDRQGLVLLYCIQFFIYASSFAHMMIAGLPDTETAGAITTLFFSLIMVFNGVLQSPSALPGFWIFMYRLSPFTYWVGGVASTELHGRPVECSASEISIFNPPFNMTCGQYLASYLEVAPGHLQNPPATSDCHYCALSNADQYISGVEIYWSQRWRNFGIVWVFVFFNIFMAIVLYWVFRIKKWNLSTSKKPEVSTEKKASSKFNNTVG
jgi:ABC-type multidrug transport system permease subunit